MNSDNGGPRLSAPAADAILFLVALIWGLGFVITKLALGDMGPGQMISVRFGIAFIIMLIAQRKRLRFITRRTLLGGLAMGVFLTAGFWPQTLGMSQGADAGKAAFITGLNIVFVPFLSWMAFRRRPPGTALVAMAVALAGMALLTLDFRVSLIPSRADMYVLLCALAFAGHIVTTGIFARSEDPMLLTVIQFGFALLVSLMITGFTEGFGFAPSANNLLSCAYLGMLSTCAAFLLQTIGQRYTTPTHASLILVMESVFGSLFGVWLLRERLSAQMVLGCALIVAGILIGELGAQLAAWLRVRAAGVSD